MSTPPHLIVPRTCALVAVSVLLICAAASTGGCMPLPAAQPPSVVTVLVEVTRLTEETVVLASPPPAVPTAPPAVGTPAAELPAPSASGQAEPPTPDTSAQMDQPLYYEVMPCQPSDTPEVAVVRTARPVPGELPMVCVTGFPPNSEVTMTVTYPDGQSEPFTETMAEDGTTIVAWSSQVSVPPGTYTLTAVQGDLVATTSVEVLAALGTPEPGSEPSTAEPEESGPLVEVQPDGDSGRDFEVTLSGFEPYQEVPLRLYVATDEERTQFEEIASLSEQVDEDGKSAFPLTLPPGDYPTSWFAVAYFLEDGTPLYGVFEAR